MSNYNVFMQYNLVSLISRIKESANALITRELKSAGYGDIAPSHGDILYLLYKFEEMTMREIADKVHRTKATTTVLIDKLEKLNLVTRVKSSADSRYVFVRLTNEGKMFKSVFENISKTLNEKVYSGITEENAELLENLLDVVRKNLE